jgi:hypothetical protein
MRAILFSLMLIACLLSTGCLGNLFGINLYAVGEKTALERQVLGTYEQIGRDLTVYASVRGVEPDGSLREVPPVTESQQAVMRALANRRYNRDDIDIMLSAGVLGEARSGMLEARRENPFAGLPLSPDLAEAIFREENEDRAVIIERLVTTTPGVTPSDREEVAWIFATLNHEQAPVGSFIQLRDGSWRTRP